MRAAKGPPLTGAAGWANRVTIARVGLVPVFMYLMYSGTSLAAAAAVFAIAAATDSLDGYLARRSGDITPLGQFLDPLADKLLIGGALLALVHLREFPLWAALVIVVREAAVSVLRSLELRRGHSLPATASGKIKTAVQVPMVLVWLLPRSGSIARTQNIAVYVVVALTVWSGLRLVARR